MTQRQRLTPLIGSYGNPAATNQRDYWRVALQLVKRAKVDLAMLVLMSAVLVPLDIHLKDWLLQQEGGGGTGDRHVDLHRFPQHPSH